MEQNIINDVAIVNRGNSVCLGVCCAHCDPHQNHVIKKITSALCNHHLRLHIHVTFSVWQFIMGCVACSLTSITNISNILKGTEHLCPILSSFEVNRILMNCNYSNKHENFVEDTMCNH